MTLTAQIDHDLKEAMKARDTLKSATLRMMKSALKYGAIEKEGADSVLSDTDAIAVLRKQVKQRDDAISSFEKGGRPELAEKERQEKLILETYLPQPLSEEEIEALVQEAIAEVGASSRAQMGAVIKLLQAKTAGRADGKLLSQLVQRHLS